MKLNPPCWYYLYVYVLYTMDTTQKPLPSLKDFTLLPNRLESGDIQEHFVLKKESKKKQN